MVAVDCETPTAQWHDRPFLVSTAVRIPPENEIVSRVWDIPDELPPLRLWLSNCGPMVFHNAKFDLQKLILAGVLERDWLTPDRIEDTEALAHLLDEHQVKKLKPLAEKYLGLKTDEAEVLREARKVVAKERKIKLSEVTFDMIPREVIVPYALKDAEFTLLLYELLKPKLEMFEDLSELYSNEMALTLVLLDMEHQTMKLDMEYLSKKAKEIAGKAMLLELEIRDMVGREDFNPNSPKQILEAFAEIGIELQKTDKVALREVNHPLGEAILELRHLRKVHGTYLLGLLEEQRDGFVHPNFRQHGARTGRMASGGREVD
jgi:DNA polymerase I-like protein with 3'-5' exonuclease and polymerase domains